MHPEFFKQLLWVMNDKFDHVPDREAIDDFISGVRSHSYIAMAHHFMNLGTELGFIATMRELSKRGIVIQHFNSLSTVEMEYVKKCMEYASKAVYWEREPGTRKFHPPKEK